MKVFKSKMDLWLLIVLLFAIFASVTAAINMYQEGSDMMLAYAAFTLLIGCGMPLWMLLTTRYEVNGNTLMVVCGPIRKSIEIDSIRGVKSTRNPASAPALSLDRIEINYGDNGSIMVSPADKTEFLNAIGRQGEGR